MNKRNYLILDLERSKVLDLNPTESILASCFFGLLAQNPIQYDGKPYYMADYKNVACYCSILPDKIDTLRRLYKRLENIGLLTIIKIDSHVCFTPSKMLRDWGTIYKSDDAEKNPILTEINPQYAEKNPVNAEKNPVYINNINNNIINNINEEVEEKFISSTLGITAKSIDVDPKVFKKIDTLLSKVVFPFDDAEFKKRFFVLCCMPKWRTKTIHAIQMQLKKLQEYELKFVMDLLDSSIMNGWQGIIYSDTPRKYQEWLRSNSIKMETKEIERVKENEIRYLDKNSKLWD